MEKLGSRGLVTSVSVQGVGAEPRSPSKFKLFPSPGYYFKWGIDPENPMPATACPLLCCCLVSMGIRYRLLASRLPWPSATWGPMYPGTLGLGCRQISSTSLSSALRHAVPGAILRPDLDCMCAHSWVVQAERQRARRPVSFHVSVQAFPSVSAWPALREWVPGLQL